MLAVYVGAIFVSAVLLFQVQPMVARLLLPVLGGTPGVWNTCMVFFQAVLLAGYAYAHGLTKIRNARVQVLVHGVVSLLPLAVLPISLAPGARPAGGQDPTLWMLMTLAAIVGLPFFVLSATSPLLQRWFSSTDHPQAHDPYFLYAASNAGSLLSLLAYPLIVEPTLTMRSQSWAWAGGYVVLAVLLGATGFLRLKRGIVGEAPDPAAPMGERVRAGQKAQTSKAREPVRGAGAKSPAAAAPQAAAEPDRFPAWLRWILLAFAPSSLMLGVTTFISTDLAAFPLLWIIPLSIYLLTMIVAFSTVGPIATKVSRFLLPFSTLAMTISLLMEARGPLGPLVALHLGHLAIASMACHGRMAATRPSADKLTGYFLLTSVGGALGGVFNAIIAPLVFDQVYEYIFTFMLTTALGLGFARARNTPRGLPGLLLDAGAAIVPAACYLLVQLSLWVNGLTGESYANWLIIGVPCVLSYMLVRWPRRFTFAFSFLFIFLFYRPTRSDQELYRGRSFFGVQKVTARRDYGLMYHMLYHGTTTHGLQAMPQQHVAPTMFGPRRVMVDRSRTPLTYYYATGPVGQAMEVLNNAGRLKNVALLGLGTGTMAAYAKPGQKFVFYEIDEAVVKIAEDPALFTYLRDCEGEYEIVLGDGRLSLEAWQGEAFDLILLDAFSSDAIPAHLLTVEAFEMYLSKLAENGVMLVHISNRHLNLSPVLSGISHRLGLVAREFDDGLVPPAEDRLGKYASQWIVIARKESDLGKMAVDARWLKMVPRRGGDPVWTDDFSNILSVMKFLQRPGP